MEAIVGSDFRLSKLITRDKAIFESENHLYGDDLRKGVAKASDVENYLHELDSCIEAE
jgi:hypothetical protein